MSRQHIINFHAIEKIQLLSKSRIAIQHAIEKIQLLPKSRIAIQHALKDTEPLLVSTARTAQFREWLER